MMKKQQELLARKMTLQNDMASNMKSAEEKMKKDHAEYRKKAETKASAAADKQVKDMKEIMDGFIKKLAANMPKAQVPTASASLCSCSTMQQTMYRSKSRMEIPVWLCQERHYTLNAMAAVGTTAAEERNSGSSGKGKNQMKTKKLLITKNKVTWKQKLQRQLIML